MGSAGTLGTAPTDFPENETARAAAGLQQNQES